MVLHNAGFSEKVEWILKDICSECGEAMPNNFKVRIESGSPHNPTKFVTEVCSWICAISRCEKEIQSEEDDEEALD